MHAHVNVHTKMWLNGNKRQIFDFLAESNCPTLGTSTVENARQTPRRGGGGMGTHGIDIDINQTMDVV